MLEDEGSAAVPIAAGAECTPCSLTLIKAGNLGRQSVWSLSKTGLYAVLRIKWTPESENTGSLSSPTLRA